MKVRFGPGSESDFEQPFQFFGLLPGSSEAAHHQFGDNHGVGRCPTPQRKFSHNPTHTTNPSPGLYLNTPPSMVGVEYVNFVGCNWSFSPWGSTPFDHSPISSGWSGEKSSALNLSTP